MTTLELIGEGVLLASLSLPILWLLARTDSEPSSRHLRLVLSLGASNALLFAPFLWSRVPNVGGKPAEVVQSLVLPAASAVTERPLSALAIFAIAWLCVSALALVRVLVDVAKLRALISRAQPDLELANHVPRVLISDEVTVPCATALGEPVILIPRGLREALGDQAFACVLTHEMHHLDRRDETWALLVALLRVPFALHPVTKRLTAELSLAREEAVDALVASGDAHTYATALLEVARIANDRSGFPGAVFMGAHALQRRISMLTNPQKRSRARLLPLLIATIAFAALGMLASPTRANAAMQRADTAEYTAADPIWPSVAEQGVGVVAPVVLRVGSDTNLTFKGVKHSEIGDPSLAESCVNRDGTIHVSARQYGRTTLTIWTDEGTFSYPLEID